MKPSDLRKGNLVDYRVAGNTIAIEAKDILEGEIKDIRVWSMIFKPIELTEDWLIKFGFVFHEPYKSWVLNLGIHRREFIIESAGWYVCDMCFTPEIKYVHQLQNLYFALTGEELPTKIEDDTRNKI